MTVRIRSAEATDGAATVALWEKSGLVGDGKDPLAEFHFAIAGPSSTVLLGFDDTGKVKGSVLVGHDGHRGWLYYVASDPDDRNKGIGRQMVEAAEAWLRQHGITKAQLLVLDTNTAVIGFYERLGFEISPRIILSKMLPPT